ncbi:MAG: PTS sugar transporter subunit IIA [Phycisphaeraceae bacterium]|nr:PTS sugar transporter subunit IIA [Phycisphaerales bacterium]MCB9844067.1 PTS sugar transporter subunit IIA [Phycisphaeraceae bacterium]
MNLLEIITPECIKVPLESSGKQEVIGELVDLLASTGKVSDPAALKEAVWTRECTRTTGIGHNLAIPHGKSEGVKDLAMAIGRPKQPLDFCSIDNRPVKLIVLLASPIDRTSDHIQALARISRLMTSEEFREKMYEAESAEEVFELLQEQEAAGTRG